MSDKNVFTQIKESVSILNVSQYYGIKVNKGGFASCPFHDEKNPSFKLYEGKEDGAGHFHCYGCGEHGDVIDLVSRLFNLLPHEAAGKIARDFGITVYGDIKSNISVKPSKPSIKAKIQRYTYELQETQTHRLLADYCDFLKRCRRNYAPKQQGEPLNPLFVESLTELEKFKSYVNIFISGSKDERIAFMRDFKAILGEIERVLNKEKARQAEELA